jgi:hypothetical protein
MKINEDMAVKEREKYVRLPIIAASSKLMEVLNNAMTNVFITSL